MSRLHRYRASRAELPTVELLPRRALRLLLMTGSLAVLMSALSFDRGLPDRQRLVSSMRLVRETPLDVAEALQRIERAAADRGHAVIARLGAEQTAPLLVLGSALGGTPVAMAPDSRSPEVPLRVLVQRSEGGHGAQVLVARVAGTRWEGLPEPVAREIEGLPALVSDALG